MTVNDLSPLTPTGVATIVSIQDLARLLRQLRRRQARRRGSSELTYRELARRTGWSIGIIAGYFGGRILPPTDRFDILVATLDATPTEQGALATARDRVAEHRRRRAPDGEPVPAGWPAPRQLPADVPHFVGRMAQLAELDTHLEAGGRVPGIRCSVLSGTAGVGKTALAVHWAHRMASRFPDGQLYADLRGFHPAGAQLDPAEVLRDFLHALGIPAPRMPVSLPALVGLYRSLLAERQVLVLLDNARDAEQVRPLLPGAPGCLVLVTSRNQLPGLTITDGARSLMLALPPFAEARQLLAARLGTARVAAEPATVDQLVNSCARLPLALAIVAARASTHPTVPLAALAIHLRGTCRELDAFAVEDCATDVRALFSCSYLSLSEPAATLFRLLGTHPGPDISAPAAAVLAGVPLARVSRSLAELSRAHLVTEHTPGRYSFHDLLRAYAAELADRIDSGTDRRDATLRVLDHYLHTADRAAMLVHPHRTPIKLTPAVPGAVPEHLTDPEQARAWFTVEHPVLLAIVAQAAGAGFDAHAWQLARVLGDLLSFSASKGALPDQHPRSAPGDRPGNS
ncbi:hypothetical protein GCM10027290_60270 [Micromonospora sonneratiae]|uniref:Helix-turn-helix domain-containing protein n=1 Tax=Micromonospora sonneratiae TaxID=1184706 RepID=A0ABW3YH79_9ACTN